MSSRVAVGRSAFLTIWAGQSISLIGSGLTAFAIAVWVYRETRSVTMFSLIALATTVPGILLSPLAGIVVDRWNRRTVMIVSDGGAAVCSLGIALLLFTRSLETWTIVVLLSIASAFESFQAPAYSSVLPLLVPQEQLGRFNGLIQLGSALPKVVSPLLAGVLLTVLPMWGIIVIDFASFLAALATLLVVRIPNPKSVTDLPATESSLLRQATEGWSYLTERSALLVVLLFLIVVHFTVGVVNVAFPALILSFASATSLGSLMSLLGLGLVTGSVALSVWGGPRRRMDGILGFTLLFGLGVLLAGLRPSAPSVGVGLFLIAACAPLIAGSAQVLWQVKVPPYLHGRVFALRDMAARSSLALAFVIAGPLADRVLEPLMAGDGPLAGSVGRILGQGQGRGVGLMFVLFGGLSCLVAIAAYLQPRIRFVEDEVPDALPDREASHPPTALLTAD
jgi:hypothetical protein